MINFRFHLASLIAIFLALALGVVVGAGVIDRGVVDTLNDRLDSVERTSDRIKGENSTLRDENGEYSNAISALECHAVSDALVGEDVGLVAVRGVDEDRVKKTVAAAQCGGGNVTGVLWLEDKWALANDGDISAMAQALGSSSKRASTLRTAAWKQLAERLQTPSTSGDTATDLLTRLADAGFVKFDTVADGPTLEQFPRRGASMLLVVGDDAVIPDKNVVVPAATAFAAAGIPLVVGDVYVGGQDAPARGSSLAPLREGDLAKRVSTVDDLDRPQGPTTARARARRLARDPTDGRPLWPVHGQAAARHLAVRRLAGAGAAAFVVLITVFGGSAHAATSDAAGARVSRVLVISLPNVEWSDIQGATLPNLDRLFAASSTGALVTNGIDRPSPIGSNYATFGAGTCATAGSQTAGQGFGVDEMFGRDRAGRVFHTRTGRPPGHGLVYMPITNVVDDNESELYGAEVGLLGDELQKAGIARAVIANGDGSDPSTPADRVPPYRRSAVLALTTSEGRAPRGRVDRGLLEADARAPFGVRLDPDVVLAAFRDAWTSRSVVLVEGSDLVRADLAGRFASDEQRERLRARALRDTDRMIGRLLREVDTTRDAVIVVGPVPPQQRPSLTPVSVRAVGFKPGLLRSTTTRHDGFVNMVDVAPTILHLYGLDRPEAMEGRRMESADVGDALASRVSFLVDTNDDGLFRDSQVGPSMTTVLVISCVLGVGTVLVDVISARVRNRTRRRKWLRTTAWPLVFLALVLVGLLDATYLAGPLHFGRHGGAVPYWLFVVAVALLLAAVFLAVAHLLSVRARSRYLVRAVLVALASIVVLHVVDLVTGAHLEWNTVFGYSPTIGIRFVGEGNITFAQLAAAAVLFAGLLVWHVATRAATRVAIGVLAVTIVVMGVPIWGNDFGAVLSALPGFALLAWMLLGHRVRARTVAAIAGIVVAGVVAVGLLDLLRPADQRTHVGKFFQKVGTDLDGATLVIRRKAAANLSVFGHSVLLGTIIVVVLLVAYLWIVRPRSLRPVVRQISTAEATLVAFLVIALLGFALNDSGIAIPGMMFAVFESTLVVLMGWSYLSTLAEADEL